MSSTDKYDMEIKVECQQAISVVKLSPSITNPIYQQAGQFAAAACWDGTVYVWQLQFNKNSNADQKA